MSAISPNDLNVPRPLLLGDAGLPGSHFCDRLIGAGHEVICMINLLTGTVANVHHLLPHPEVCLRPARCDPPDRRALQTDAFAGIWTSQSRKSAGN